MWKGMKKRMRKERNSAVIAAGICLFLSGCASVQTEHTSEINVSVSAGEEESADVTETEESSEFETVEDAAVWIDEVLSEKWDKETKEHRVTFDDDGQIYVQIWREETTEIPEEDKAVFEDDIIPSWIEATEDWLKTIREGGLDEAKILFQYCSGDEKTVFFELDDSKLTYFCME